MLVVLRPEPGASATADRARKRGWKVVVAPLFTIEPIDWQAPNEMYDALLLTSANAVRYGGTKLADLRPLPVVAVGETSAATARGAGFAEVKAAGGSAEDAAALLRAAGYRRVLHLAGRDARGFDEQGLTITRIATYAAVEVAGTPAELAEVVRGGAIVLVHSARAGAALAARVAEAQRAKTAVVAISEAALEAAGEGWRSCATASAPEDGAMLDAAGEIVRRT